MTDSFATLADIETQIAAVEENLRTLIEKAAAISGAADEELTADRIAEQQAELERLQQLREHLTGG